MSLQKEYAELSTRTAQALEGLEVAMKQINDTNILHVKALESHTKAILDIKEFWGKIVWTLTIAVAILAGLEKFSKLISL